MKCIIGFFLTLWVSAVHSGTSMDSSHADRVPVVLWHGLGDSCCNPRSIGGLIKVIQDQLPGTHVLSLRIGGVSQASQARASFFMNAHDQLLQANAQIGADAALRRGFVAVGFSQGGQFLRAYVQQFNDPPVRKLITLGGQHQGVFGLPQCVKGWLCEEARRLVEDLGVYSDFVQKHLAPANYWNDPLDQAAYLKGNTFLPKLNNQLAVVNSTYKKNLQSLQEFLMVTFTRDTVVEPISSESFGFYPPGNDTMQIPLNQTDIWQQDLLGLRETRLAFLSVDGNHLQFSTQWFIDNIISRIKW